MCRFYKYFLLAGLGLFLVSGAVRADEAAASRAYVLAKAAGETELNAFFNRFPKGADLHNHLTGAVFAESYIHWAQKDGMCINPGTIAFAAASGGACAKPYVLVQMFLTGSDKPGASVNDSQYEKIVNALSMRNGPWGGVRGHDHFFAAFAKFGPVSWNHFSGSVAWLLRRAAEENIVHLELMATPDLDYCGPLAKRLKWSNFPDMAAQLDRAGFREDVSQAAIALSEEMLAARKALGCQKNQNTPGCQVSLGFLFQINRAAGPENVFTKAMFGAALAEASPWVYGVNIVAPEDGQVSLHDYTQDMKIIAYADASVHRALHAGELTLALVPPEDLKNHIRQAVEVAHAERIGHGSDIAFETDASGLMREMADKGIAVELALSSNQQILNLDAGSSPFHLYHNAGVPIVLSTDDPGIERTSLSHEYDKAAGWFDLSYADFKHLSEDSLRYSFLSGTDLWADAAGTKIRPVCAGAYTSGQLHPACIRFLEYSPKAHAEWALLRRFALFERSFPSGDRLP